MTDGTADALASSGQGRRFAFPVTPWLLLLPAAVLLVSFTHLPAVATLINSFYSTPKGRRPSVFIGGQNYQEMLADPVFWASVYNNLLYAAVTIPATIALALLMALIVNSHLRGRALMRLSFFMPTILPMIAVANMWLFFYTPDYGVLDRFLSLFGQPSTNWLGNPETALWCIILLAVWKEAGFFMIFYLAALQQISPTLREAAAIDGTSRWYFFRRVTFPLLMPTTLFVMVNAIINAFRVVDHVIVLTRGGPDNSTMLILYYVYNLAFRFWDSSYASAVTIVLMAVAVVQFGFLDRKVHYK